MKYIIFYLLIFSCLIACNKENSPVTKNTVFHSQSSMDEILRVNNTSARTSFSIQEFSTIGSNNKLPHSIIISGGFKNKSAQIPEAVDAQVQINGQTLQRSPDLKSYFLDMDHITRDNNLFGKKIGYSVTYANSRVSSGDSMYIPEQVRLDYPGYVELGANENNVMTGSTLRPGQTISWNPDRNNTTGVLLYIEYIPTEAGNGILKSQGFTEQTSNGILVDDTGSFVLTSELFQDVPNNSRIRFAIARGGYKLVTDESDNVVEFKIYAVSVQEGAFKYSSR